ncbi:unnamed protein product [Cuscuta europaea]|uniref:Uncharacterized protein n=1 Tax=Cuscuta europaea TaxID=41803 RepID=A0A9P0ZXW6_CUSEU|nr:unnamed protein product [Cuscuta europaea]
MHFVTLVKEQLHLMELTMLLRFDSLAESVTSLSNSLEELRIELKSFQGEVLAKFDQDTEGLHRLIISSSDEE